MSECLDCPVYLRGLAVPGAGEGPTILARTDHNFIQGILETVAGAGGPAALAATVARAPAGEQYVKLYPPVQRTFNVAVLTAGCDIFGDPRLDPARIESAGLVVRRIYEPVAGQPAGKRRSLSAARKAAQSAGAEAGSPRALAQAGAENVRTFLEETTGLAAARAGEMIVARASEQLEGWAQMGPQLRGWASLTADELDLDPDPARRRPQLRAGNPLIDAMLSAVGGQPRTEAVAPLFVAPPEVCAAAGKTVLYGLIPVTSPEQAEVPETLPAFPSDAVAEHLSSFLRNTADLALPRARQRVDFNAGRATDMAPFVNLLRQLAIELDAFGATPAAQALYAQLNRVRLPFTFVSLTELPDGAFDKLIRRSLVSEPTLSQPVYAAQAPAGDFLRLAVPVLVERQGEAPGDPAPAIRMPDRWPALTAEQRQGLLNAITRAMTDRLAPLASKAGRYDEVGRRYRVRAFIRVKGKPGCPPTIVWSEPSAPFTIAPWYESGDAPPVQVRLPDPTDRNFLKKVKPNVAFIMPEGLFNMLNRSDPKNLQAGSAATGGPSIGLQWICSFSIPIITLCAFIVLFIFLTLFDLIFRWLMFIKICIPFPKPR